MTSCAPPLARWCSFQPAYGLAPDLLRLVWRAWAFSGPSFLQTFESGAFSFRAVNLAQMVIAGGCAGLILELSLPQEIGDPASLLVTAAASTLAALVYTALNSLQVRMIVRVALGQTQLFPWTDMSLILVWQAAVGTIGGTLGATLKVVGIVLLPIFFVVYLIGQLAYKSYADLREAHESTIRGFIKTLEAKDMFVHGHTARVAGFARMIGEEMGFSPNRMELIRWAALLHDVGAVAVPRDLLIHRRSLTDKELAREYGECRERAPPV